MDTKVVQKADSKRKPPAAGKGRKKGVPNKITADVKAMILTALEAAGGAEYLYQQALEQPRAFMALVGKVMPLQLTGDGGGPLVFERIVREVIDPKA